MKRWLAPTILLFAVTTLFAQNEERTSIQTRIEKQSGTINGDRGLFTISSVETLNKGQFSFGAGWNNFDRTPRDLDINAFPVSFAYGVMPRLTVMASYEVQRQVKASNLVQTGFNSSFPYVTGRFSKGPGDTYIAGKYRIWRQSDNIGGVALRGFVKLGTADPAKGLGTGQTDGGAELIFTSALPWVFREVLMHSSMGYTATRNGKTPFPVTLKDEVRSAVGAAFPSDHTLQGIVEYVTTTFVGASSANAATVKVQNPSDVSAGLRFLDLRSGMTFNAGYRINTKFDKTFPNNTDHNGLVFGISYTKPVRGVSGNHYPVVALEADSVEVASGGLVVITATGFDADNDSLTYSWTSTAGKVEGTGPKITFSTSGLAPGKYTIRATAMDGKGGIASGEIDITIRQ